jgi:hypothetical protein
MTTDRRGRRSCAPVGAGTRFARQSAEVSHVSITGRDERRIHLVVVTRNTEYHFRRELCIAIRDVRTGRWLRRHTALFRRVTGALLSVGHDGFIIHPFPPRIGESLVFDGDGTVTSAVIAVLRPPRQIVETYPADGRRPLRSAG